MTTLHVTALVVMALVPPALGQDPTADVTLRGLTGINVVVEDLPVEAELEQAGLTRSTVQANIEAQLEEAGIRVLDNNEWQSAPGRPWLFVRVQTMRPQASRRGYAYMISLDVMQRVRLTRDPSIDAPAVTWTTGEIGSVGGSNLSRIRDSLRAQVDLFINAYWAVNPKP